MAGAPLLDIRGLSTRFATPEGDVLAIDNLNLAIAPGERVGIVGESGSGKSQLFLSVMGLLAANGRVSGSIRLAGRELVGLPAAELNRIRGDAMAMIFQDPMTCLNPYLSIGRQLTEVLIVHRGLAAAPARARARAMLAQVGIAEPDRRLAQYPHELSGGMRQRVMIAMALLADPALIIADEPTTALDVTIQAQILELFRELEARATRTALVLITHDLGVIAGLCERVVVMYGGRIVETGSQRQIFYQPRHPYTRGLLAALPRLDSPSREPLPAIPGQPPNLQRLPAGCSFAPRCARATDRCRAGRPELTDLGDGRAAACFYADAA